MATWKVKDWLKERSEKSQFEFIDRFMIRRLKDGLIFKTGETKATLEGGTLNIADFYDNKIHVWIYVLDSYSTSFDMEANELPNEAAIGTSKKNPIGEGIAIYYFKSIR